MKKTYIYDTVCELIDKYGTRNPFQLMESLNIQLFHSSISTPKGYSIISYGIGYAAVSDTLDSYERRIVGAHELGHLILHADKLKVAAFYLYFEPTLVYKLNENYSLVYSIKATVSGFFRAPIFKCKQKDIFLC